MHTKSFGGLFLGSLHNQAAPPFQGAGTAVRCCCWPAQVSPHPPLYLQLCERNSDPSATPPVCSTTAGTFTSISLAVSVDTLHPYEY
ncbi:hypothetical protein PCANC_09163 [Puccinia coronata f. sp. avenae]|uniref:Uncharacterized protein n=1 Tax=Puccinia coronata f. sp. avenae TaxID=200324 RepID=A0A2N5VV54_9BASI|nr:hypothetical protein PCANC_09163 [Puccinia coronata f. sp. avenae]